MAKCNCDKDYWKLVKVVLDCAVEKLRAEEKVDDDGDENEEQGEIACTAEEHEARRG